MNAHNNKLFIPLKQRDIMAARSSSHWSFIEERLFSPQLQMQLVIVCCSIVSGRLSWHPGEVSLKYNLWPVCQGRSFYCHWFVHYNILGMIVIVMPSFRLNTAVLPHELMMMLSACSLLQNSTLEMFTITVTSRNQSNVS